MQTRYLTVSCLYPSAKGDNCMPLIALCGKWLENAGFIIGDEVSVEVTRKGELVIRTVPDIKGCWTEIEEKRANAIVDFNIQLI